MTSLSALALAWAAMFASTAIWATARSRGLGRPSAGSVALPGRTLMVRPCAGAEPTLLRALASTGEASRSFPMALRVAVARPADTAVSNAEEACAGLRGEGMDARLVLTGARGPNRKSDQLARTLDAEHGSFDVVIVADSDVDLEGVNLDELVSPLRDATVAAAWAVPVESAPITAADRGSAAVLDASLHSFPLLAGLDPDGMVGKLFAIRRDALEHIGGFGSLTQHLGEDMELARRLRAAGYRVALAPVLARSLAQGRSWATVIERYARWITVIRAQRPHLLVTYPALLVAAPLIVALSCVAAVTDGPQALGAALLAVLARLAVAWRARLLGGRDLPVGALALDALVSDTILLAAFTRAVASRRTVWRGVTLRPATAGTFVEELQ